MSARTPPPAAPSGHGLPALAGQVQRRDGFAQPLRTVAGFAAGIDADGTVCSTAVLLDADSLAVLDRQVVRMPAAGSGAAGGDDDATLPHAAAVAALSQALAQLPRRPDVGFVAGHGIAHPRRFGIASHFGVAAGLPTVGVADAPLLGTAAALHEIRGAHTPLRDGGEQVGWLLRSRPGAAPLVVSPGHRVSMTAAAQLVMRCVASDRLPEPLRLLAPA
jgi:deoxyribonuclease V